MSKADRPPFTDGELPERFDTFAGAWNDVLEAIRGPSGATPEEKETLLGFTKADDTIRVHTTEAGLTRRFLLHPLLDDAEITVERTDGERPRYNTLPAAEYDPSGGGPIVGLHGELAIGALGVKTEARRNTQHAEIVSDRVLRSGWSE